MKTVYEQQRLATLFGLANNRLLFSRSIPWSARNARRRHRNRVTRRRMKREEDFSEILEDAAVVNVLDDARLYKWHISKSILKISRRDGRALGLLLLQFAELFLFTFKIRPFKRFIRRCSA